MKRRLLCVVAAIIFAIALVAPPHAAHVAAWDWGTVTFEGVVTRPNGTPVPNVMVMVDCFNGPSTFTDANGHYLIQGSAHLCLGDSIAVFTYIRYSPNLAANDAATLLDGTVYTTTDPNKINRADIRMGLQTIEAPEYGWVGGLIAASGGTAIIAYTRYLHKRTASRSV